MIFNWVVKIQPPTSKDFFSDNPVRGDCFPGKGSIQPVPAT